MLHPCNIGNDTDADKEEGLPFSLKRLLLRLGALGWGGLGIVTGTFFPATTASSTASSAAFSAAASLHTANEIVNSVNNQFFNSSLMKPADS